MRERGRATGERWRLVNTVKGEKGKITTVKEYIYPKVPDSLGQVRSFRETWNLCEIIRSFRSPLSSASRFARNLIWDRFG
jgi:hypothetical protein